MRRRPISFTINEAKREPTMTTTTTKVFEQSHLGEIILVRKGETFHRTLQVLSRKSPKHLQFTDGSGFPFRLTQTDRRHSVAVIEDDSSERQEALKEALVRNGWLNVEARS
jgi:hypothetical protein